MRTESLRCARWLLPIASAALAGFALPACSDSGNTPAGGAAGTNVGGASAGSGNMSSGAAGMATGGTTSGGAGGSGGVATGGSAGAGGAGGSGGAAGPCMPADALICKTTVPFPASIKATGIFTALPDLTKRHANAHYFEPNPPLWSDGMAKERLLILPAGTSVDNSNSAKWKFPDGTVLVKTFYDDSGPSKARRPIETRFIRHGQDPDDPFAQWEFAVYQWNADSTDATLVSFADPSKGTPVQVTIDRMEGGKPLQLNGGQPFTHQIPSKQDCQACHDSNAKTTDADVIGFDELRLNWKLPGSDKTQLEDLVAQKVLTTLPAAPATITNADPVLQRVEGWVFGNCVHCHNGAEGMLDLHPSVFVTNTVNKASAGAGIMPPDDTWKRVVPKMPEKSILFVQARRTPLPQGQGVQMRPMPPVGVEYTDAPAIADLQTWINSL